MAWNEPGDSKDKDPWGNKNKQDGPPDLGEVFANLQKKLTGLLGGTGNGQSSGDGGSSNSKNSKIGFGMIVVVLLVLWGLSGLYIIDEGKRGVVLRFGAYHMTTDAGLHWRLPYPVDSVDIVDVSQIRNVEVGYRSGASNQRAQTHKREALMLTQDENIVDVKFAVQYRVKDAKDYLFNNRSPNETLVQATESAVREIVGRNKMDFVITEGRNEVVVRAEELIQSILDHYKTGLLVTSVNMQDAQPPEEVQAAFSDAVKAREDEQRLKSEAEAYANDIIPKARGGAARMNEEANAYKAQVVAQSSGEAQRFLKIYNEYKKAPVVTRERIYIEHMEQIMSNTSKVMLDVDGGNNMMFLPLDKLMQRSSSLPVSQGQETSSSLVDTAKQNINETTRKNLRNRGVR